MLVLLTGLPGSGKSHLARTLASALNADVLDRDAIRNAIFPPHDLDYSTEQNELASRITYQVAEYILLRDRSRVLILDGRPFSKHTQVNEVVMLAQRVDHPLCVIYCWAPDAVVRQRLENDIENTGNVASGRNMEKYLRIKSSFEPLQVKHLSVNTDRPIDEVVQDVLNYLENHG
jgi:adenylylsulfate kinase